tara:strand:- start:2956 stop:3219 length:264 start_codon:yes stop_codon:yes gene_type:complete
MQIIFHFFNADKSISTVNKQHLIKIIKKQKMVSFYPLKLYNIKPTPLPKTEDFEKQDLEKTYQERCGTSTNSMPIGPVSLGETLKRC